MKDRLTYSPAYPTSPDGGRLRSLIGNVQSAVPRELPQVTPSVPIASLLPSDALRLNGENDDHVAALARVEGPLPPILVHRSSMRVIDGMHRLRAAESRGQTEIAVQFFDGTEQDAHVLAVQTNAVHGLPLSLADRKAAAAKIVTSHQQWSDRKIASVTGLSPSTVGAIRRCSTTQSGQLNTRIGKDGVARPLDAAARRAQVGELIRKRPDAPIREIARLAGVAPSTAHDVRNRYRAGKDSVPSRSRDPDRAVANQSSPPSLEHLMSDPALRLNEAGRTLLRLLHAQTIIEQTSAALATAVPAHSAKAIAELAHRAASTWHSFANQLERRHSP